MLFFLASPSLQSLNFSNNFWIENTFEIILMFKLKTNGTSRKSQIPMIKISSALARGKIVLSCYRFLVISNCWVNKKRHSRVDYNVATVNCRAQFVWIEKDRSEKIEG